MTEIIRSRKVADVASALEIPAACIYIYTRIFLSTCVYIYIHGFIRGKDSALFNIAFMGTTEWDPWNVECVRRVFGSCVVFIFVMDICMKRLLYSRGIQWSCEDNFE